MNDNKKFLINFSFFIFFPFSILSINLEKGETLFIQNCIICHREGNNIIIAEKNLKKENLERNGMSSIRAITYQVRNGKNGMPAFGDRLNMEQIKQIAAYILEQSNQNFEK
jgi:cytochrome c6